MTLMYRSAMAGACAVALSIALTGIARAVPLSSSFERVIAGSADPCGSATCPGLGGVSVSTSDSSNQARASATATSSPALSASASGGGALGASATAEVDYFIEWLDPTRTAPIPTLVDLILHTAVSADAHDPNSFAEAIATFNIAAGSTIIQPAIGTSRLVSLAGGAGPDGFGPFCQTHPCSSPQNFSGTLTYNLDPNVLYSVQIAVTATTGDSILPSVGSTTQSAEASLDPHIYTKHSGTYARYKPRPRQCCRLCGNARGHTFARGVASLCHRPRRIRSARLAQEEKIGSTRCVTPNKNDLGETAARRSFCLQCHVRSWHKADIPELPINVRFQA